MNTNIRIASYIILSFLIGVVLTIVVTKEKYAPMEQDIINNPPEVQIPQVNNMQSAMHSMTSDLEGKVGTEFDKAFVKGMILHHQGAVEMAEAALKYSDREEIKQLARQIIDAQNAEIEMMQKWEKDWGYTNGN